jgi:hypothetical protein
VFRSGEHRPVDKGTELERIILYVPARILDLAEALSEKAGAGSVQDYCALLLMQSLENERVQQRVAEFEARQGPLEGLKQIAEDPHYLAEWQQRSDSRTEAPVIDVSGEERTGSNAAGPAEPVTIEVAATEGEARFPDRPDERDVSQENDEEAGVQSPRIRIESSASVAPVITLKPKVLSMNERSPTEILLRHVRSTEDELGFLPCLRRGTPVPNAKSAELIRALRQLEEELRGAEVLSRKTAHALHRLALESQVLLTDAWPGRFDERTIATIRTVQEAVERILSGEDIRYYSSPAGSDGERPN